MFDRRALGAFAFATLSFSLAVAPAVSAMPSGSLAPHAAQSGPVTVEATARAASAAEARKEAIVAALRKVVGEYVEADVEIADDEVVKNELLSFSNAGGVKSEQVGDVKLVGDEVEVTMRVTVEPKPLVARVKGAAKVGAKLDGAALAAEIAAAKDDYEAKKRVLDKAFADLPDAFMTLRIVDSEGKDTPGIDRKLVQVDKKTGQATVTIPIVLGFDMAVWKNTVYPALDQVLTAAAMRKMPAGRTLKRGDALRGELESLNTVPFSGARTIPNLSQLDTNVKEMSTVALMRENLGKGRQLNFDVYEFDKDELPLVSELGGFAGTVVSMLARTVRVRFLDSDGESIDGTDEVMTDTKRSSLGLWTIRSKRIFSVINESNMWYSGIGEDFRPFAWLDPIVSSGRHLVLAPIWVSNKFAMPEIALPISLTMPYEDLELIERIEVELIKPAGN